MMKSSGSRSGAGLGTRSRWGIQSEVLDATCSVERETFEWQRGGGLRIFVRLSFPEISHASVSLARVDNRLTRHHKATSLRSAALVTDTGEKCCCLHMTCRKSRQRNVRTLEKRDLLQLARIFRGKGLCRRLVALFPHASILSLDQPPFDKPFRVYPSGSVSVPHRLERREVRRGPDRIERRVVQHLGPLRA